MHNFRKATAQDLNHIIDLLQNDALGAKRERIDQQNHRYQEAMQQILESKNNDIWLLCLGNQIVGCAQITFIPNLTYTGGLRAQIEGVRISQEQRGKGFGKILIEHLIEQARLRNAVLVQLTTDKQRPESIDFYKKLGFNASHEGFKFHF